MEREVENGRWGKGEEEEEEEEKEKRRRGIVLNIRTKFNSRYDNDDDNMLGDKNTRSRHLSRRMGGDRIF